VKAIRAGRAQLKEAYVIVKNGEIMLIGAHITPLSTASTHIQADPVRTRRLLLHRPEINRLVGQVERAGYTLIPLDLHYSKGRVKLAVGDDPRARVEPRAAAAAAQSRRGAPGSAAVTRSRGSAAGHGPVPRRPSGARSSSSAPAAASPLRAAASSVAGYRSSV
jgi:hypothetical protein